MSSSTYPPASSGGIKSVQRGLAASAGTVTITSVDITKSFVTIFGTTSSGTCAVAANLNAATGTLSAPTGTMAAFTIYNGTGTGIGGNLQNTAGQNQSIGGALATNWNGNAQNISLNATNLVSTNSNLVAAIIQGYLSNSTSLVVSGACRWEVVEFN